MEVSIDILVISRDCRDYYNGAPLRFLSPLGLLGLHGRSIEDAKKYKADKGLTSSSGCAVGELSATFEAFFP